jgi:hypothetical protein
MRIRAGREHGDFLVPDMQPLNAAMAPQCIGEAIEAVAHDSIDTLDTSSGERFDHLVCNSACHDILLRSGAWFWRIQWFVAAAHRARGDLFMSGARPGLISAGLRGATGLSVGRVTVAPLSSPIRGTQLGDGCGL